MYLLYLCIYICNYYYTVKKINCIYYICFPLDVYSTCIIYVSNIYVYICIHHILYIIYTPLFQPARQSFGPITIAICFGLTPGDPCVHDLPRFFGRWGPRGGALVQFNLI